MGWGRGGGGDLRSMDAKRMVVVKKTCRFMLKASCGKKYCSITCQGPGKSLTRCRHREQSGFHTSRQTKSSNGNVVNIFNPKQNRATLIRVSF